MAEDGYLRVAQLRAALAEAADDLLVVLAKDGEGKSFSPLAHGGFAVYVPESTWAGEVYEGDEERSEHLMVDGAESCVVLWPTN